VGAILLGYPINAPVVADAIKAGRDVTACLYALRAGEWRVLGELA
jgi:hypothetical protein